MPERHDIAIFGAGAWGTALAMTWARQGANIALWGHPAKHVKDLSRSRKHPRLPGVELPHNIRFLTQAQEAFSAPLWVSALPSQICPSVWTTLASQTKLRPGCLISASKGILAEPYQRVSEALEPILGVPVGVLSGPSFAHEVALERPTALVLAFPISVEDERAQAIQALLATSRLRIYLSRDVVGVELCGAFKNVLAIAAGLVEAIGLGHNARAALLTRGLAEMARLVERMGGKPETVMGLAGMGDLLLTATGEQSRNRRFGEMLGRGHTPKEALASMDEQVVEGVATTEAALQLAQKLGVELPITAEVARLIQGADLHESVDRLMNRSLKSE